MFNENKRRLFPKKRKGFSPFRPEKGGWRKYPKNLHSMQKSSKYDGVVAALHNSAADMRIFLERRFPCLGIAMQAVKVGGILDRIFKPVSL
ncbi:hypothetical protein [Neorhizobium galegae]|uniref:hypothetical protein n=1 Tax=Neorhizobium galegae TaxID=399 RepID=UPI0012FF3A27|nr:hypothetical protein [Neorhizobium galegae]